MPNWAQDISKAAPWAIFGLFLIVFMYVMPYGIAGFLRLLWIRVPAVGSYQRKSRSGSSSTTFNPNGRTS